MALSKLTADQIVAAVVADSECQRVINWPVINATLDPALPPVVQSFAKGARTFLEYTQTAGAVRNAGMLLMGKGAGDPRFDERICLGISLVTEVAILKAMKAGNIPGLRSCFVAHRVTGPFKVHHQATNVRTEDDNWYVFDWHATLTPNDPAINTESLWMLGASGINYRFFNGFG